MTSDSTVALPMESGGGSIRSIRSYVVDTPRSRAVHDKRQKYLEIRNAPRPMERDIQPNRDSQRRPSILGG
jgi:hypothetical protein